MIAATAGCEGSKQEESQRLPADQTDRPAVPLRVVLVGAATTGEAIQQAWTGISEQPLQLTALPLEAPALDVVQQARQSDVVIYPAHLTAALTDAEALSVLPDAVLASDAFDAGGFLPALRSGPMQYGGQPVAVPLGAVQPMVFATQAEWDDQPLTWQQYQQRIGQLPQGRSAEPLAEGWAAMMFLWRANSYSASAWLFDRDRFQTLLTEPPYEKALTELVQSAKQYPDERMTPQQVWQAMLRGQLDVAIGWPAGPAPDDAVGDVRVLPLPTAEQQYGASLGQWQSAEGQSDAVLLSGREPVASIAASCRQTAFARQFLQWLSGADDQSAALREWVPGLTVTRRPDDAEPAPRSAADPVTARYQELLRAQLEGSRLRPMLRLPGAGDYLRALDEQVIAAIEGRQEVPAALRQAAAAWEQITERHGRNEQQRAWRRSQGMRY